MEELGGEPIDVLLRTRAGTLAQLHAVLAASPSRSGNRERLALLVDSRDEPWSELERQAHRLLRAAGLTGWRTNWEVRLDDGVCYLDIAFPDRWLALELDGRAFHGADRFEADRTRQNALVLAGWTVLRFTAAALRDRPEAFVAAVRQALDAEVTLDRLVGPDTRRIVA